MSDYGLKKYSDDKPRHTCTSSAKGQSILNILGMIVSHLDSKFLFSLRHHKLNIIWEKALA